MTSHDTIASAHDADPGWGQSLAKGGAGIILLHAERARKGIGDWRTVHNWATAITSRPVHSHPDISGLFHGAPAVAYALTTAGHPAYAAALDDLDSHVAALVRHRLAAAHSRIDAQHPPAMREYDLVSGLTGLGVLLLQRHPAGALLHEVLAYLVRLTEPLRTGAEPVPGWWTGHGPQDRPSPGWPGGHANLGMAHGIAGPLALLAAALRHQVTVPGQIQAIERICHVFDRWRCGDPQRPWWPGMISAAEHAAGHVDQLGPQRPSWCYGTPGIARAQQLAARVLGDRQCQHNAEAALARCLTDETDLAQLTDASLCHGWAGLTQAAHRTAHDAGPDSELVAALTRLHPRIDHHLDPGAPSLNGGLVEGGSGIALARHTLETGEPPASAWDTCLLLAG